MELKRRTLVAGLFPNVASLLRLVSAPLVEFSEEWETGRIYLSMDSQTQPSVYAPPILQKRFCAAREVSSKDWKESNFDRRD